VGEGCTTVRTNVMVLLPVIAVSDSESDMSGMKIASMGFRPPIMGENLYVGEQHWNMWQQLPIGQKHVRHARCNV